MIRTKLITIGVVAALLAICSATQANQWEHQSSPWQEVPDPGWALNYPTGMAWVLGPDGSTIRSPVETPQPTELTWSIVPGGVAHWLDPTRLTRPMTDLDAFGLSTFADYRDALEGVVNEWASACGIINAGYVHEDGTVLVGDVPDTDADGNHTITDRGFTAGVGHIRFMAYDQDGLDGASSSGQATYIPEPGSAVDNAYNRRKAGDVRLRSDADIFGDEGLTGGGAGYYFRRIAMHEMGHTLGFGHNTVSDSVMGGGSVSEFGLGEGDIEGALAIYGPVPEPATLSLLALGSLALIRRKRRTHNIKKVFFIVAGLLLALSGAANAEIIYSGANQNVTYTKYVNGGVKVSHLAEQ